MASTWNQWQIKQLLHMLEVHMCQFGYEVCDLPVLEDADLFLIRAGDQIIHSLFAFEHENRYYALRPEFTTAAAYLYGNLSDAPQLRRWQFNGPIFQSPPDNNGLPYQRLSVGAELIGDASLAADVEVIAMALQGLNKINPNAKYMIRIGHVGITKHLLSLFDVDLRVIQFVFQHAADFHNPTRGKEFLRDKIMQQVQYGITDDSFTENPHMVTSQTLGGRTRSEISARLQRKKQRTISTIKIAEILDFMDMWSCLSGNFEDTAAKIDDYISSHDTRGKAFLGDLRETVSLINHYSIPSECIEFRPSFTRSWDYYTGMVFEILVDDNVLVGGGRYDDLQRLLGASIDVPAVGFAYDIEQIIRQLHSSEFTTPKIIQIAYHNSHMHLAISLAQQLRSEGFNVALGTTPTETPLNLVTINQKGDLLFEDRFITTETLISTLKGRD
jgi:ATP phosphoribosyltransferase regulatory subunit